MAKKRIKLFDTTLRDGMQAEGVSFSLEDKLTIARSLDKLGIDYVEGGYAASNEKEMQFFKEAAKLKLKKSKLVAFGSTHRPDTNVAEDVSLKAILSCRTPAAVVVGKTWDMHVKKVLRCSLDRNVAICSESVGYPH